MNSADFLNLSVFFVVIFVGRFNYYTYMKLLDKHIEREITEEIIWRKLHEVLKGKDIEIMVHDMATELMAMRTPKRSYDKLK